MSLRIKRAASSATDPVAAVDEVYAGVHQAAANARFLEEMGRLGHEYRALAATAIQSDPELSADIARHNFASVGTGPGRAELDQRIAALLAARAEL